MNDEIQKIQRIVAYQVIANAQLDQVFDDFKLACARADILRKDEAAVEIRLNNAPAPTLIYKYDETSGEWTAANW
jgi:hypothetical protein